MCDRPGEERSIDGIHLAVRGQVGCERDAFLMQNTVRVLVKLISSMIVSI